MSASAGLQAFRESEQAAEGADGARHVPRGSRVLLLWGAANRHRDELPNPDAIDLGRRNAKAHLAFGLGVHRIRAALARLEARATFETSLARASKLRFSDAKILQSSSLLARSLASLPVELAT